MRRENAFSPHVLIAVGMLGLTACSDSTPPEPRGVPISEDKESVAIRIESDGTGNCNFDANPLDLNVAALSLSEYAEAAQCGACIEVEGPNGKMVHVRIVDSCSACEPDQLALNKQAFDAMGAENYLQVSIRRRYVTCPVQGPVRYHIQDGSSQWWVAIQVRNHLLPIQKMEWDKDGTWIAVERKPYNYFVEPAGMGPGPVHLRITATNGQQLEDTLPQVIGGTVDGAAQFTVE